MPSHRHLGLLTRTRSRPRLYSSESHAFLASLSKDLTSRELPVTWDHLVPRPSYLLSTTLSTFLPPPPADDFANKSIKDYQEQLVAGHHLVYFPPPTLSSQLLEDGTDTIHSPGGPYTRRLWAGGSIKFPRPDVYTLHGQRAAMVESIEDVQIKGPPSSEKIFVGIGRSMVVNSRQDGFVDNDEDNRDETSIDEPNADWDAVNSPNRDWNDLNLYERRDLCFMTGDEPRQQPKSGSSAKILRPPKNPEYTHSMVPDAALLFRFSALTFNAHAIHIDPEYTRKVYGLPKLLVHGPLSLVIMLTCVRYELEKHGRAIREIRYRNFAPLFVGEEMRICGKRTSRPTQARKWTDGDAFPPRPEGFTRTPEDDYDGRWEVWIEKGKAGEESLAVLGTVETGLYTR